MSYDDCSCDYNDYETPAFYSLRVVKARIVHKCTECRGPIHVKETYEYVAGKWDGNMYFHKICCRCMALRDHLKAHVPCFCHGYGDLLERAWEEVRENHVLRDNSAGLLFELGRMAVAIRHNRKKK